MKNMIIFSAFVLFISAQAFADVRFENKTELLLGVRMQNQTDRRTENYVLIKPKQSASVHNSRSGLNVSAQLITGSYEINCCEWVTVPDGKSLIIRLYSDNSQRCYCEIK